MSKQQHLIGKQADSVGHPAAHVCCPAGETTDLGEPRPSSRFRDRDWQEAAAGSGPFQEGWREPPGRDLTYIYSMLGTGIGIAVGWASQYMH
jgi:hypothetical protein